MNMKEESEKIFLKLSIQKLQTTVTCHFMANIKGKSRRSENSFFLASKITGEGDCSHEIRRHLLFGIKAVINLDSILKSRDITLMMNICIVKAMVFPVAMYRCEDCTRKKAKHGRTDPFELQCQRRLLRVPSIARSNQSTRNEIIPEYSLEGLMLKLKL